MPKTRDLTSAARTFRRHGGTLRTRQALALGIHPATLYHMRDTGRIVELSRGLFKLAGTKEAAHPDLAVVGVKAPAAAVCLVSALSFHEITTQIPTAVDLAVPRGRYYGFKLDPLPARVYRYDARTFDAGLRTHRIAGVPVKIYEPARTVADCFKFRSKVGMDVAIEALRLVRQRRKASNRELLDYARLLRVERAMLPYVQALT